MDSPDKSLNSFSGEEISALYEKELSVFNENLKKQAALSFLQKLNLKPTLSVNDFFEVLKEHRDIWAALGKLHIAEFIKALCKSIKVDFHEQTLEHSKGRKRNRINDKQKDLLKEWIVQIVQNSPEGLKRKDIVKNLTTDQLSLIGISPLEIYTKLRQPIFELVKEFNLKTSGHRRLLRYVYNKNKSR